MSRLSLNITVPAEGLGAKLIACSACLVTILSAGCEVSSESGLNPRAPSALASLTVGQLSSSSSAPVPSQNSCIDLQWFVSQETASMFSGSFSATCGSAVQAEGTLTDVLVDDQLDLNGVGTATPLGSSGCDFTVDGTARIVGDTIQLDYAGRTCL